MKSISKRLIEVLGGKWSYYKGTWLCDDDIRTVVQFRTLEVSEHDECLWPIQFWLYGEEIPRMINNLVVAVIVSPRVNYVTRHT